jgi:hypothetical protein
MAANLTWSSPGVTEGLRFWEGDADSVTAGLSRLKPDASSGKPPVHDPRDLHGIWQPNKAFQILRPDEGAGENGLLPYRPDAEKLLMYSLKMNIDGFPIAEPPIYCRPLGPQTVAHPIPFQIFQEGNEIWQVFGMEWSTIRVIHLNQEHPRNLKLSYQGHSVGHWEANTLVIDTIGFNAKTTKLDFAGSPHSNKLHLIERWTKSEDGSYIDFAATYDDPVDYIHPFTVKYRYIWRPKTSIGDSACEGNPRSTIVKEVVYDGVRPAKFAGGDTSPTSQTHP